MTAQTLPAEQSTTPSAERVRRELDKRLQLGLQYIAVNASGLLVDYAGGVRDAATGEPVTRDTLFLSASSSKVLTAAAVLTLAERGALRLDDPLARYVPYQPYGERVNLSQLLSHTSGVPNPLPLKWLHTAAEHARFSEDAALRGVLQRHPTLQFEPGTRYAYSNLAYWLLGKVIEAVSGLCFDAYLQQSIREPLQIDARDLSCEFLDAAQQARGHVRRWSLLGLALPLLVDATILSRPAGRWARFEHLHMNGPAYGGVRASARGYARFLQDLLQPRSRVLGDAMKRLFFAPQRARSGRLLPTTLGWHTGSLAGERYLSKPRGGHGFHSNLRIYPARSLATVFLSNQMRASEAQIERFADGLDRALLDAAR